MSMKKVLILLSTYNGEKYLREQLDSLYAQENIHIHILARDDGSSDKTLDILEKYKELKGHIDIVKGKNIGAGQSFFELGFLAYSHYQTFEYYAFCDQDDVWHPDKLQNAVQTLENKNCENKLYFCRANYVDSTLQFIKEAPSVQTFNYKTCIYRNPALGCTMVFDKSLLDNFVLAQPHISRLNLHDTWLFKCAVYTDAFIASDNKIYIDYRQHGNNVTVANKGLLKKYYLAFIRKYKRKKSLKNSISIFYEVYKDIIVDKKKLAFLRTAFEYDLSITNCIKFLKDQPWETENPIDKLLWRILVLCRLF